LFGTSSLTVQAQCDFTGTVFVDGDCSADLGALYDVIQPAVIVNVYSDANGNGVVDGADAIVGTAVTDGLGNYNIPGLPAGDYIVSADPGDFYPGTNFTTTNAIAVDCNGGGANTADIGYQGQSVGCWATADQNNSTYYFNSFSGNVYATTQGGCAGGSPEALAINPDDGTIYVGDNNQFGTLDPITGCITNIGGGYGTPQQYYSD